MNSSTNQSHATESARLVRAKDELRAALAAARAEGSRIGLVPTMGYLHEGHLSLLRAARAECDVVVMSLFVNPTQFGEGEDLDRYPRDEERDARLAVEAGVDYIYAPPVEEVYPEGFATAVEVEGLTEVLDGDPGRRGPGHFRGVTTVVAKLLNTVQPEVAYFGQKDAQQLAVIRRMVRDLDIPVDDRAIPTVREPDGLALSSRNAYLSPEERARAASLHRALVARDPSLVEGDLEYLAVVDPGTFDEVEPRAGALVIGAARFGGTRLIDNIVLEAP
jgi:pantoate--beta-alanine ligase